MSYNIAQQVSLGAFSDVEFTAAADSIATEFAKTGKWTDPVAAQFTSWANVAYDQRSGAPGVEWFEQVVDDRWRNGPGCQTSWYSSSCSVDSAQEEAMRAGLIVLGDQVVQSKSGVRKSAVMSKALAPTISLLKPKAGTPTPAADEPTTPSAPPIETPPIDTGMSVWWYVGGAAAIGVVGLGAWMLMGKKKAKTVAAPAAAAPVTATPNARYAAKHLRADRPRGYVGSSYSCQVKTDKGWEEFDALVSKKAAINWAKWFSKDHHANVRVANSFTGQIVYEKQKPKR